MVAKEIPNGHGILFFAKLCQAKSRRHLMHTHRTDAPTRCGFCAKPLPIVNGELQPWRASSGQFFCNEFCADDADEASFQSHRTAKNLRANIST
jgi:hypothetical protein